MCHANKSMVFSLPLGSAAEKQRKRKHGTQANQYAFMCIVSERLVLFKVVVESWQRLTITKLKGDKNTYNVIFHVLSSFFLFQHAISQEQWELHSDSHYDALGVLYLSWTCGWEASSADPSADDSSELCVDPGQTWWSVLKDESPSNSWK